jgi:hypothetical protein
LGLWGFIVEDLLAEIDAVVALEEGGDVVDDAFEVVGGFL